METKAELYKIFNVDPLWANLAERKYFINLLEEVKYNLDKWYAYYNKQVKFVDIEWAKYHIDLLTAERAKLEKKIVWLRRIARDMKTAKDKRIEYVPVTIDIERIKEIPINRITEIMPNGFFKHNPFRNEQSPSNSLHWNKNTNKWTDYGSGEFGDVIDLYMKLNGCDFKTAIKELNLYV